MRVVVYSPHLERGKEMKLLTVQEMRELEQAADQSGHSYATMMELAGQSVAAAIQERLPVKGKIVLVLVGPGNNGGDGLVAARRLKEMGAQVVCYLWKPRPADDVQIKAIQERSIPCVCLDGDGGKTLRKALQGADVIVDALLGTGASRPIKGDLADMLRTVHQELERRRPTLSPLTLLPPSGGKNGSPCLPLVVAVDVPSGIHCDTAAADPLTLPADLTVTFAAPKRGLFGFPAAGLIGELVVADIGISPDLSRALPIEIATAADVAARLPARPLDAHKGTFGKALVVAGSVNYVGAPYLAAAAAARVGAGLVTLAPPQPLHPILAARLTEATFIVLPHSMGVVNAAALRVLSEQLPAYSALLIGPGLGQDKETVELIHRLFGMLNNAPQRIGFRRDQDPSPDQVALPPLVIDADALNALALVEKWWERVPPDSILTPHPGEMARLMGCPMPADRIAVAAEQARLWQQIVVLKGAHTVIAAPDGRTTVLPFANPALATAGSGDVLAGAIVGLLAQGLPPFDAAVCGAYLHGLAGHMLAVQMGSAGLLASDLVPALPLAMRQLRQPYQRS